MKTKKNKLILIVTLILLALPLVICAFLLNFSVNAFNREEFWYAYLAFFGTIVLGAVAIYQNKQAFEQAKKANEISNRLLDLEERHYLPVLDIDRNKSSVSLINNDTIKIKLNIKNVTDYFIHNICLSLKPLNNDELRDLYLNGKISTMICDIENLKMKKKDEGYILTCVASLRNIIIEHWKNSKLNDIETINDSENLYFNYNINVQDYHKIDLFLYMQNVVGELYLQNTKIYIAQRNPNDYFLTMHSKTIKKIEIEDKENG